VDALCRILAAEGRPVDILSLHQQSLSAGNTAGAVTYLEHRRPDGVAWAAGMGTSTTDATLTAVVCAANRRSPSAG
jgi:2-isopropylmalate synthase